MSPAAIAAAASLACLLPRLAAAQATERCINVEVGSEQAYGCMNEEWARLVSRAHSARDTNTLSATSPAPAVGTFNRTATAERMGNTFGHSVIAQRPPPPVYIGPMGAGR